MGRGYPPPQLAGESGERCELSQRGPRPKTILVRSKGTRTALVAMHATEMT